jgi:patatin-like phospholipase/acyl hydrolase
MMSDRPTRILCLDGGGAKGFYTLGVLAELEALAAEPLCDSFDLIFGTSTGAIIAALLALGRSVPEIHALYKEHVVNVVAKTSPAEKTKALEGLAAEVFGDTAFTDVRTGLGIVATRWAGERPMIFKGDIAQAHGRKATFRPGFGVLVGDAVVASCSAFPFFERKTVTTADGDEVELIDGGYCANNPTLYAIADATAAMGKARKDLRVVSIGTGVYPEPKRGLFTRERWLGKLLSVQLLQKTLEINTQSMDQLRVILFKDVPTVRISDTFQKPELATDLFEHDLSKLNLLRQQGVQSFAAREAELEAFLR